MYRAQLLFVALLSLAVSGLAAYHLYDWAVTGALQLPAHGTTIRHATLTETIFTNTVDLLTCLAIFAFTAFSIFRAWRPIEAGEWLKRILRLG